MKLSKQQLADIFDDAADFDGANEDAFDARKALLAGTLEIEGYEQSKWTHFDPDDETTYPPKGKFIAYGAFEGQPFGIFFGFNYDNESTKKAYGGILKHWMYAPKPPRD